MANEIKNYRMQQKRDTAEKWGASALVPKDGEILIYKEKSNSDFQTPTRIKVGDGKTPVKDLEFITGEVYVQATEPIDAGDGAVWINPEESSETQDSSETSIGNLLSWEIIQGSNEVTLHYVLEDDSKHMDIIVFDANGYPVSITHDGVTATGTWRMAGNE